jgi:preprotein translocase subunit SecG
MFTFVVVLISIIAVLMTLAVLLQSGKGGGLAGIASGGATTQILGSRQAPDFLEKATWYLGASFIVLCILSNFVIDQTTAPSSVIQGQSQGQTQQGIPALPPADAGAENATEGAVNPDNTPDDNQ